MCVDTKENLAKALERVCLIFWNNGILVSSITTDNCAAFCGAVEELPFGTLNGRCACHGIQLIIKLFSLYHPTVVTAIEIADEWIIAAKAAYGEYKVFKPPLSLKRFVSSRWNSRVGVFESVIAAHKRLTSWGSVKKLDGRTATLTPLSSDAQAIMERANFILQRLVEGIRAVEYDNANQLHVLHALSKIGFLENDYDLNNDEERKIHEKIKRMMYARILPARTEGIPEEKKAEEKKRFSEENARVNKLFEIESGIYFWKGRLALLIDAKVHDRIISPSLVITAWFSGAVDLAKLDGAKMVDMIERIKFWLTSTRFAERIVLFLAKHHNNTSFTTQLLGLQFESFCADGGQPNNVGNLTEENFQNVIDWMKENNHFLLGRFIQIVKNTLASEASAERGFSRVAPHTRSSLAARTVAMHARYGSLRAATASAKEDGNIFAHDAARVECTTLFSSQRIHSKRSDGSERTESQALAEAATNVIDLAIEKLSVLSKHKAKKNADKGMKERCFGPKGRGCTNELVPSNPLLLCANCRLTKCVRCLNLTVFSDAATKALMNPDPKSGKLPWTCASCKGAKADDWFMFVSRCSLMICKKCMTWRA